MNKRTWIPLLIAAAVAGGVIVHANANTAGSQPLSSQPASAQVKSSASAAKPAETHPKPNRTPALPAWAAASLPDNYITHTKAGLAVVTNASSRYVLVNKKRSLPSDYVPKDLVIPKVPFSFSGDSPKKRMRKEAAAALEQLFAGAGKAGIKFKAVSGYRSYATQKAIFDNYAAQDGKAAAERYSAHPGQSEHQTGLAMDISSASVGYGLEQSLGATKEGIWLAAHAADYGFIIRYPKGKEEITGYMYEPWHVRYFGKEAAKDVQTSKLTLEEFYDTFAHAIAVSK